MSNKAHSIGLDIGSTTVKIVVLEDQRIIYSKYQRHYSDISKTLIALLEEARAAFPMIAFSARITGSGGLTAARRLDIEFIQEVIAAINAVEQELKAVDCVIELGGEDAKITFFKDTIEQRMNGTCAGGTGAFIDQMASLLNTDPQGLNELAKTATMVYPIAARCGVFAKSDIQPLLNEGANKGDIAKSIFQAVVNQTISGLACGMPIRGTVCFLGGPLTFLSELRKCFKETLKLDDAHAILPSDSELYVALGAAYEALLKPNQKIYTFDSLIAGLGRDFKKELEVSHLLPLFESKQEYQNFLSRHQKKTPRKDLQAYQGDAYLGIDCGSTTTKMVLIGSQNEILYEFYAGNQGEPLKVIKDTLLELYRMMPEGVNIKNSCVTGYGEALIKAALRVDLGEIETVAHQKAAEQFLPGVEFILDIGGQDMKCITAKDGVIYSVLLNEACSAGCGSFLENFAASLSLTMPQFVALSLQATKPVDLGSRCTVFMNSKVKQAQKEGAAVSDIAAGLAYSVVKNSLYKVIRLRDSAELGAKIIVQGGTFLNDAVLRAFEKITGKEVVRPDISGIMGAYGCALIAKSESQQEHQSTLITRSQLATLNIASHLKRCGQCLNNCALTIYHFDAEHDYISGNRCERGLEKKIIPNNLPNLYKYKYERLFKAESLPDDGKRKIVGLPRVLNMYENYPFWHAFFTSLNYRVVLSSRSSRKIYEKGIETIPSESVCYPGKLVHGHVIDLIDKKVDVIFYPSIFFESKEVKDANNQYNCPIVISYPEVIKNNVDALKEQQVKFLHPFLSFHSKKALEKSLCACFKEHHSLKAIRMAVKKAFKADQEYKSDLQEQGEKVLKYLEDNHLVGIVLAGRPYHIDPEINHKIDELIVSYGYPVLTEDAIYHLGKLSRPIRVVDQWVYHSRLYQAADYVTKRQDLELIQLNSFGCGLDAVTTDQVKEILEKHGKIYTVLKIDEVSNLGSIKIRIRSLKAAIDARRQKDLCQIPILKDEIPVEFTKDKKATYTILAPQMAPYQFELLAAPFKRAGYLVEILKDTDSNDLEYGLKYVHNDACYPSIITTGQIMKAVLSGKYDVHRLAVIISQTGGGCRATNYIAFIRKALKDAGLAFIPVIGLGSLEKHSGFKIDLSTILRVGHALLFGDLLMRVTYRMRPYEFVKGTATALSEKWSQRLQDLLEHGRYSFSRVVKQIVSEFDAIEINETIAKPKVGLVGEILVKFHPFANNNVVALVEKEGGEAVMPDLYDFFLYGLKNAEFKKRLINFTNRATHLNPLLVSILELLRRPMVKALSASKHFNAPHSIAKTAKFASEIVSLGNQTGEGWFLTGEMVGLIHDGVNNIVCMQPFACLPNHVTGKGMIKALRNKYPLSNIVAVDYDPGTSEVNQINRIKLMMAAAFKNLNRGSGH
ncbi:MAG: 2-hydroxyacyl-CoA dehydratase [Erysipelotrichaceae bacterium]|jgi:predicted CoA-substrate-specific enzyme activase|nr:2-hydroxyacyl-CoA dehydratase [Erysipelotrichaceae bacterium]